MRSRRLEQLAKRALGGVTASVYGALLRTLESKTKDPRDEPKYDDEDEYEKSLPASTLNEIAEVLDPTIDLASSIKGLAPSKRTPNGVGKKRKNGAIEEDDFSELGIKGEHHSDSEDESAANGLDSYRDRAKRIQHIEAHLALLEEHPKQFCKRALTHGSSNEWRVNFAALVNTLITSEVDNVISARHGKIALRLVRLLRDRGRVDEKTVQAQSLMRSKDIRAVLTELQFQGFVDPQELPKDNQRQPSKTLYLWFFDSKRVQSLLTQQTYKAMSRTLQRIDVERARYRSIIEKAERSDIKGNEEKKLDQNEKQVLRKWREVEERLLSQVARMDEFVALLRDFSGNDTSLNA
jgi:DNA-directed RNA polymerase III subunit RPC3